jgi:uncharacterized protein (DUF2126 family)/transglutaminase-like putative cysteine protease
MGTKVQVHHKSRYHYEKPVWLGPQIIQLRPTPHCRTPILSYSLEIKPTDSVYSWQFDPLANHVARVVFPSQASEFLVTVDLIADMTPVNPFAFLLEPEGERMPFSYRPEVARDLEPFLAVEAAGPLLTEFVESVRGRQPTIVFLLKLNERLRNEVAYTTRLEHGVQSCEETLSRRTGSCRDSSWLLVQICRQLGLAARFVSGYLIQLADHEKSGEEDARKTESADLHAWAEVYLPGAGWIGLDPTSGLLTSEGHIPLACSTTPGNAAPIYGTLEPADVEFTYEVTVRRMDEPPSLTIPFSEHDWNEIRELAYHVDRDLKAQDVRLTMGGEPTFVGIDDAESAQWNVEALGRQKRSAGLSLIRSIRQRTALGALLHFGQGKWYPGEPMPRWAFHCISRKDGVRVWENGDLFALESKNDDYGNQQAHEFLQALSRRLGAEPGNILLAMEAGSAQEEPAGFVLPLRRRQPGRHLVWSSQPWFERPVTFTLSAGDSPIGYRIPLEMMPWVAPDVLEYEFGEDGQVTLPSAAARRPEMFNQDPRPDPLPAIAEDAASAHELIRPSLCVQARDGRLHVFLPYVSVLADYLDLVAAVEETSQYLQRPVWIEGYSAPPDLRLQIFSLTPDPGVLEVNMPPTSDWDELESLHEVLAEEAPRHRLIAGKFGYDGTHLATGGGSHITLGGATIEDSPILRRPDVLRSMVSFWQNHPSLSYLFAGMYVGPTSQYPRVDEARVDALYELEVAFSHLPAGDCPPSIVDGLFRNLLVDVTGNSHRAEFCIDKLYPPEGQGRRFGLLELRAFEMPPHYRMGLLQTLLVRALVALFWNKPFTGDLLRWGTALHDRFMLPHFVERDFIDVLDNLRGGNFPFVNKWFASHFEFRFPKIGEIKVDGARLELRQALEPWNVLAEETTSGGTGRSVDSSLERIQVKITGFTVASRYAVSCNGRSVPLHPSGTPDEAIAGVRYRARRLSTALHPTIPVHTPLTFDLIDTWKKRCVGRCVYYASQPDGTLHTTRPADAAEAKERRLRRFVIATPPDHIVPTPPSENNPVFPMTLDLRWPAPLNHPRISDLNSAEEGQP